MCNNCDCENYEKCSIVGYMNFGSCCNDCFYFDEMHSCEFYIFTSSESIISMIFAWMTTCRWTEPDTASRNSATLASCTG